MCKLYNKVSLSFCFLTFMLQIKNKKGGNVSKKGRKNKKNMVSDGARLSGRLNSCSGRHIAARRAHCKARLSSRSRRLASADVDSKQPPPSPSPRAPRRGTAGAAATSAAAAPNRISKSSSSFGSGDPQSSGSSPSRNPQSKQLPF